MKTDYQSIVDQLRSFLQTGNQILSEDMAEYVRNYVAACQDVNQRLRSCRDLLSQGLREEAIHLAEANPNLLDSCALLDIPERAELDALLKAQALSAPPKLILEAAEALNVAYAEALPLKELQKQHRYCALAQAPISKRLGLLRKIAALDSSNPMWNDDIPTFEKAHQQELEATARQAVQRNDVAALNAVRVELNEHKWIMHPATTFLRFVEKEAQRLNQQQARQQVQQLESQLQEAYTAHDFQTASKLYRKLTDVACQAAISNSDALFQRLQPAVTWLQRAAEAVLLDRKFEDALNQLKTALDTGASPAELDQHMTWVRSFERELPRAVEARYHEIIEKEWQAARKRRFHWTLALCGLVLLVTVLVIWSVMHSGRAGRAAVAASQLQRFIEQGKSDGTFEPAEEFLDKLKRTDPAVLRFAEVEEQRQQLRAALTEEEVRRTQWQAKFEKLEPGPAARRDSKLFSELEKSAKLPVERSALRDLKSKDEVEVRREHENKALSVQQKLNQHKKKIDELEQQFASRPDAPETRALAHELSAQSSILLGEAEQSGSTLHDTAKAQDARVHKLNRELDRIHLEGRLTAALKIGSDTNHYVESAQEYVNKFGDTPRGLALKQALSERPMWDATLAWGNLLASICDSREELLPAGANKLLPQFRAFQSDHPGFADSEIVARAIAHLEAIRQRDLNDPNTAAGDFKRMLRGGKYSGLWYVSIKTPGRPKVYYVKQEPDVNDVRKGGLLECICDEKLTVKSRHVPAQSKPDTGPAPQSVIASEVLEWQADKLARNWEKIWLDLAAKIYRDSKMDPVCKVFLLKKALDSVCRGSGAAAETLKDYRVRIDGAHKARVIDLTLPWIQPDGLDDQRDAADRFLRDNLLDPRGRLLQDTLELKRKQTTELSEARAFLVGWLSCEGNEWKCHPPQAPEPSKGLDHELYVLVPRSDSSGRFELVGQIKKDQFEIRERAPGHLAEGRLLFAKRRLAGR